MRVDAVIVGARCAGAATAMLLARAGARVLLLDKGVHGTDTLSTHALMRGAVLQLHRWGVLPGIVSAGTPPVHSTTFSYSDQDVVVPIEPRFGVAALYAPRRALLDRALVDAAEASGAEVRYGVRVDDVIVDDHGHVRGISAVAGGTRQRIDADIVIGADGLHSTIAQRVEAPRIVEGRHATGVLYKVQPSSDGLGITALCVGGGMFPDDAEPTDQELVDRCMFRGDRGILQVAAGGNHRVRSHRE